METSLAPPLPPPLPPRPSPTLFPTVPPLHEPTNISPLPPSPSEQERDLHQNVSMVALVELLSTTPKATANLITDLKPLFALWDGLDYALSWKSPPVTISFWWFLLAVCRWITVWSAVVPTPFVLFTGGLLVGLVNGEKPRRNSGLVPRPPSAKATVRTFYTTKMFRTFCSYLSLVRLLFLWRHPPSSRFALRTALALYPFWAIGWSAFFCFPRTTAGILCTTLVFWRAPIIVSARSVIASLPAVQRATRLSTSAWTWWCQDFVGGNDVNEASRGIGPQDRTLKNVESDSWSIGSSVYRGLKEVASKGKNTLRKTFFALHKTGCEGNEQVPQRVGDTVETDDERWLDGFHEQADEACVTSSGYQISGLGGETWVLKNRVNRNRADSGLHVETEDSAKAPGNPSPTDSIAILMTKEFAVYENQRWWVGLDWVPLMLPHDPPPWSDVNDLPSVPPQQFRFPPIPPQLVQSLNASARAAETGRANLEEGGKIKATTTRLQWRWLEPRWHISTAVGERKSLEGSSAVTNGGWEYRNHFWQNKLDKYRSTDLRIKSMNSSSSSLSSASSASYEHPAESSSLSISSNSSERSGVSGLSSKILDPLLKIKKTSRTRMWVRRAGLMALEE